MATSIVKLSKSFFVKLLVGIIILPFVFWGMGDVFRGGNQNVIANIESKKLSTQEFVTYVNRLNLNDEQLKNLKESNLIEKLLSEYIGKKVMDLEIDESGIQITDNSLRDIIKSEKIFFKDNKFSRTEYEKFLLGSGITAPSFEKNIVEQESKRQFLEFLSGGISISDRLIENEFKKENQIKSIEFIDLNKYYLNKKPTKEKINEFYQKNKNFFKSEFKSFQYAPITPKGLINSNEYNEQFFSQLDIIENNILDGQSFEDAVNENNLKVITTKKIGLNKKDKDNNVFKNLPDNFFNKIFTMNNEKTPEIVKSDNNYYLVEVKSKEVITKSVEHPDVLKAITDQLKIQDKIRNNTSIAKDIGMGGFDKNRMKKFAEENKLEIKNYTISSLKQNEIFSEGIIKNILMINDGEINLITDSKLSKNFIILALKTDYKKFDKKTNKYDQYKAKARLNLMNKIYKIFDERINQKYKVKLNKRTIERVKNSF